VRVSGLFHDFDDIESGGGVCSGDAHARDRKPQIAAETKVWMTIN